MDKHELSIITLNVQGLLNARNRKTLFSWLNCAKPVIIVLKETHCRSEAEEEFRSWLMTETRDNNNMQSYCVESFREYFCDDVMSRKSGID